VGALVVRDEGHSDDLAEAVRGCRRASGHDFPKATDEVAVLGAAERQVLQQQDEPRLTVRSAVAQGDAVQQERIPPEWVLGWAEAVGLAVAQLALQPLAQWAVVRVLAMAVLRVSVQPAWVLRRQESLAPVRLRAARAWAAMQPLKQKKQPEQ